MKKLIGLLLFFVLSGCVLVPPVARIPFPESEYASLKTTGTATVRGQAFMRTRGGDVKTAAGFEISLNPVTSYSGQWYEVNYLGGKKIDKYDDRVLTYVRRQRADADGRFVFKNVPEGEYFLVAPVHWEAPGAGIQGGIIAEKISVKDGQELDIILTK